MDQPQAEDFESDLDSIEIDIVDVLGNRKENHTLQYKDDNLQLVTVAQERHKFARDYGVPAGNGWVIVTSGGERINMVDALNVIDYRISLDNSDSKIITV